MCVCVSFFLLFFLYSGLCFVFVFLVLSGVCCGFVLGLSVLFGYVVNMYWSMNKRCFASLAARLSLRKWSRSDLRFYTS